ncbi:MAG: hypothetical protein QNJ40_09855 [Xanthomonadales bacterium]|nr:hypothetical protein [Xanthomonadales bacterium]
MIRSYSWAVALLLLGPIVQASETERLALQGLPAEIALFVNLPAGVAAESIRSEAEALLKGSGLEVQEFLGTEARTALEIVVSSAQAFPALTGSGGMVEQLKKLCTTVVETKLSAPVVLKMTKQNSAAEVWSTLRFGVMDCDDESMIRQLATAQVREFVAAYQLYNP